MRLTIAILQQTVCSGTKLSPSGASGVCLIGMLPSPFTAALHTTPFAAALHSPYKHTSLVMPAFRRLDRGCYELAATAQLNLTLPTQLGVLQ